MNKIWQIYAWFTIAVALLVVGVFVFWAIYPYTPLVINTEKLKVVTKQVKPGDMLYYEVDACKNTNLTSHIARSFVDTVIYNTATIISNNPSGCRVTRVGILVPQVPPGKYYLNNIYSYEVNPIRRVDVVAQTEMFEISK